MMELIPPQDNNNKQNNNYRRNSMNTPNNSGKYKDSSSITRKKFRNQSSDNYDNFYQGKRLPSPPSNSRSNHFDLLTPDTLIQNASSPQFSQTHSTSETHFTKPLEATSSSSTQTTTNSTNNSHLHGKELLALLHEGFLFFLFFIFFLKLSKYKDSSESSGSQNKQIEQALLLMLDVKVSSTEGCSNKTSNSLSPAPTVSSSPTKSSPSRISPNRSSRINADPRFAGLISSPAPANLPLPVFQLNAEQSKPALKELEALYSNQLTSLRNIGFTDDEKSLKLLVQYQGNVDKVVVELLK